MDHVVIGIHGPPWPETMYEDVTPPDPTRDREYRTVEFTDGLLIFDRENTARWLHSDIAIPLGDTQ